jgi:hypothetical protein
MARSFQLNRRPDLRGSHHRDERSTFDYEAFPDYCGTPFLTALANFCAVAGAFRG